MDLEWGLRGVIPDTAVCAWGARAILREGVVDFLYDRKSMNFKDAVASEKFIEWLEDKGISWVCETAKSIAGNSNAMYSLDDGKFHIRCNANASYGYLYISAWCDE